MKKGLREAVDHIRELKSAIRPNDANRKRFSSLQRARYAELHDTQVLGKALSAEVRRGKDQEISNAA